MSRADADARAHEMESRGVGYVVVLARSGQTAR